MFFNICSSQSANDYSKWSFVLLSVVGFSTNQWKWECLLSGRQKRNIPPAKNKWFYRWTVRNIFIGFVIENILRNDDERERIPSIHSIQHLPKQKKS